MNKNMIKISQNQWIASGIKKGYVIPEEDGTFTLKKEALGALIPAALNAGKFLLSNPYTRSALMGAGLGSLTSLVGRSNLIQSTQDWWSGGSETPEMLKALQAAKGKLDQDVKSRLGGISTRLDSDLARLSAKIDERIATFTQRLTERGIGPAFEQGQKLLADDEAMANMQIAAQKPPANVGMIYDKIKQTPVAGAPPVTPAAGATPATGAATATGAKPAAKPVTTGGASVLNQTLGES